MFIASCIVVGFNSCKPEEEKKVDVPTDLNYSDVTHNSAVLTWKGTTTSYEIEVGDVISKVVTAKTLTATELSPETEYEWRVRAIDGDRKSEWVNGEAFTTDEEPIAETPVPTNLAYSGVTISSATLTWQHVDADAHEIIVGDDGEAVPLTEPTYTATGLTPNTEYTWKVRSAKEGLWSNWVDGERFTTESVELPTNLAYSDVTYNSAKLTWEHTTATQHELIVGDREAVTVLSTAPLKIVTGLEPDTEYTWKVRSRQGSYWSEWVDGEPFTTEKTPIPAPTGLSWSDVTSNSAVLSWQGTTASYEIEVGDGISEIVSAKTFTATELTPETSYTWRVRAIDDNDNTRTSDWVNGTAFTTPKEGGDRTPLLTGENTEFWEQSWEPGVSEFTMLFSNVVGGNGTELSLLFYLATPDSSLDIIDIPAGTYPINESMTEGTIAPGMYMPTTYIRFVTNGTGTKNLVNAGTVVVEGDHTNYHITFDIIYGGETLTFEFNGPLPIENPM